MELSQAKLPQAQQSNFRFLIFLIQFLLPYKQDLQSQHMIQLEE